MTGPEHYRTAEQLAKGAARHPESSDAQVLAQLAQVHATLALADPPIPFAQPMPMPMPMPTFDSSQDVTVYRAAYEHEPFPLGLYANREAAQAHCEAEVGREHPADVAVFFDWIEDEDEREPLWELVVRVDDAEHPTGYTVTAVVAEAAYDPEADT